MLWNVGATNPCSVAAGSAVGSQSLDCWQLRSYGSFFCWSFVTFPKAYVWMLWIRSCSFWPLVRKQPRAATHSHSSDPCFLPVFENVDFAIFVAFFVTHVWHCQQCVCDVSRYSQASTLFNEEHAGGIGWWIRQRDGLLLPLPPFISDICSCSSVARWCRFAMDMRICNATKFFQIQTAL